MNVYANLRCRRIFSILLTLLTFCIFQSAIFAQSGTVGNLDRCGEGS